jgi:hypothetical protein
MMPLAIRRALVRKIIWRRCTTTRDAPERSASHTSEASARDERARKGSCPEAPWEIGPGTHPPLQLAWSGHATWSSGRSQIWPCSATTPTWSPNGSEHRPGTQIQSRNERFIVRHPASRKSTRRGIRSGSRQIVSPETGIQRNRFAVRVDCVADRSLYRRRSFE